MVLPASAKNGECELMMTHCQIRASHSLLSLSHTLKLLHLFADSATPASVLERLSSSLASDIAALKLTASGPSNA